MVGRRPDIDFGILVAQLAPVVLLGLLWWAPGSLLRVGVALVAVLWAPGHLGLAIIYPLGTAHMSGLERAGLAVALGLLFAPIVGLALSLTWSLTTLHVAVAYAVIAALLGGAVAIRAPQEAQRRPLAAPGTRVTVVLCVCAIAVAGSLWLFADNARAPDGASLSLVDAAQVRGPFPRQVAAGAELALNLQLEAGGSSREGRLVVRILGPGNTSDNGSIILDEAIHLARGASQTIAVNVPPLAPGTSSLVVRWELPAPRTLHLWFDAGPPHDQ